jgi:amino acid efflux transporter
MANSAPTTRLKKTIGPYRAVALALGIVVGAGMLALPGLVYREAGGWAVLAWALDGILVIPLLFVFATLGRRYPSAGGVAGFVGEAFPGLRAGCSYLLVGTFSLGLPAIAIAGAEYLASGLQTLGIDVHGVVIGGACMITAVVLVMACLGGKVAGGIQSAVVTLLIACLAAVVILMLPRWANIDFTVGQPTWRGVWSGMGLAFFAYTGWEMLAFMSEEFENPKRDFPLAVGLSLVVVMALYVGVALSVQAVLDIGDERAIAAPFFAIANSAIGGSLAPWLLTAVVLAIIVSNLNGAVWAASRLLFDIGRNNWAPAVLALHRLDGGTATPRRAIAALAVLMGGVLAAYAARWVELSDLFRFAGQNFFLLYTMCIVAFIKLHRGMSARLLGISSLAVCVIFAGGFGYTLLYAGALFAAPYVFLWSSNALCAARRKTGISAPVLPSV